MSHHMNRRVCLTAIGALVLTRVKGSKAATPMVKLGEIRALATKAPEDLPCFRRFVEREFESLQMPEQRGNRGYILSATLTELKTVLRGESHSTTCVVDAILRERSEGAIRATMRGSVRVLESDRPTRSDDLVAMQAAVRRALSRVKEALG